ncbi:hypothetical protein CBM2606_A30485 [Cupriavidus taiwanensis]|nr:hypothetical protein CBM2606_A30485 [Cupriavidus taiwanensis]
MRGLPACAIARWRAPPLAGGVRMSLRRYAGFHSGTRLHAAFPVVLHTCPAACRRGFAYRPTGRYFFPCFADRLELVRGLTRLDDGPGNKRLPWQHSSNPVSGAAQAVVPQGRRGLRVTMHCVAIRHQLGMGKRTSGVMSEFMAQIAHVGRSVTRTVSWHRGRAGTRPFSERHATPALNTRPVQRAQRTVGGCRRGLPAEFQVVLREQPLLGSTGKADELPPPLRVPDPLVEQTRTVCHCHAWILHGVRRPDAFKVAP